MTEREYWRQILVDLQTVGFSVSQIAEFVGVDDRLVWRWKAGRNRPTGLSAVRLFMFHGKRCAVRPCPTCHVQAGIG